MPRIVWDRVGERQYESGLDRGVLYLPDGTAVAWNGLTEVVESSNRDTEQVYYDGSKIAEIYSSSSFSARLSAVTYPDEFVVLEGAAEVRPGVVLLDQNPGTFGLSYRTKVGNDLVGEEEHYKIHLIYNATAIPADKTWASISDDPELVEFEWDISAVPEVIPGFKPTAHMILDTKDLDPWLLEELEAILYGSAGAQPALISMRTLIEFINDWARVSITDNGDGTWTATEAREGFITPPDEEGMFLITGVNANYIDEDTFEISDTIDATDLFLFKVFDNEDGTFSISSDHDGIVEMLDPTTWAVHFAELEFEGPDMYRVSDTTND
jgi:hypothetical protein